MYGKKTKRAYFVRTLRGAETRNVRGSLAERPGTETFEV